MKYNIDHNTIFITVGFQLKFQSTTGLTGKPYVAVNQLLIVPTNIFTQHIVYSFVWGLLAVIIHKSWDNDVHDTVLGLCGCSAWQ